MFNFKLYYLKITQYKKIMKTYSDRKKSMLLKNVIFLVKSHSLIKKNNSNAAILLKLLNIS